MARVVERHPALRWAAPLAAVVVAAGIGLAGAAAASADDSPNLPDRTAAQMLADLALPTTMALSGTVAVHADLGLPEIPGLTDKVGGTGVVPDDAGTVAPGSRLNGGGAQAALVDLLTGDNTLRVWSDGPEHKRVAILGDGTETDLIRNGADLWLWQSADRSVLHATIPEFSATDGLPPRDLAGLEAFGKPLDLSMIPTDPEAAATLALAAADTSTEVTVGDTTTVAGRDAYQLVATPRSEDTLVEQVVVAIDAETHLPLRVEVFSTQRDDPALSVAYTDLSYETPAADVFVFTPPDGATVSEVPLLPTDAGKPGHDGAKPDVTVTGEGWSTVVVAKAPESPAADDEATASILDALPEVSGSWGTGHALSGTLFSVIVTDDGRVAAGAVPVSVLEDALAQATP